MAIQCQGYRVTHKPVKCASVGPTDLDGTERAKNPGCLLQIHITALEKNIYFSKTIKKQLPRGMDQNTHLHNYVYANFFFSTNTQVATSVCSDVARMSKLRGHSMGSACVTCIC